MMLSVDDNTNYNLPTLNKGQLPELDVELSKGWLFCPKNTQNIFQRLLIFLSIKNLFKI